jgi:hypothetical protein
MNNSNNHDNNDNNDDNNDDNITFVCHPRQIGSQHGRHIVRRGGM